MNIGSGFLGEENKSGLEQNSQQGFDGVFQHEIADPIAQFRDTVQSFNGESFNTARLESRTRYGAQTTSTFETPNLLNNGGFDFSFEAEDRVSIRTGSVSNWRTDSGSYGLLNWKRDGADDAVLELDSTWSHDSVFQDIQTSEGGSYLLSFDYLAFNGKRTESQLSEHTNDFDIFWDGEFIQRINAVNVWQSGGVQLSGKREGVTRLEFREVVEGAFPGGDASGPLLDNVRLSNFGRVDVGHGLSIESDVGNGLPGWRTFDELPLHSGEANRAATDGSQFHTLNASRHRDGIYRDMYVEAGQEYTLLFDLQGNELANRQENELRVRWDNQWVATVHGTGNWNTYSVSLRSETAGLKRLVFAEPGEIQPGSSFGPVIDNVRILKRDQGTVDGYLAGTINTDFSLAEVPRLVSESSVPIALGNLEDEVRLVSFDVAADFDFSYALGPEVPIEDTFNVYLVEPGNSQNVILDNGVDGGALFSLKGDQAEFPGGRVTFNGTTVTIDVTSLSASKNGELLFQLLNNDGDNGTTVGVSNIDSQVFVDQESQPAFLFDMATALPADPLDLSLLTPTSNIAANVDKIRFDSATGNYTAEVTLQNTGPAIGRNVAAIFKPEIFPAIAINSNRAKPISLLNQTGTDEEGHPYINFRNAIPSGGLATNGVSEPIEVQFRNASLIPFSFAVEVRVGGPNQAPVFTPVDPITVMPGSSAAIQLEASDPDDDDISYSLVPNDVMPTTSINGSGLIEIAPTPDQIGSYVYTVMASDGAETIEQTFSVDVVTDPLETTRISGSVLDVDGSALVGIPVALGDLVVVTDADGNFMIEFMGEPPADALEFRGNELPSAPGEYPFVAEKLELLFGRETFVGFNNVIDRPVYLPALDLAQADHVDGMSDTMVDATLVEGEVPAELFIAAETLVDDKGVPFVGDVSITEVPRDLTPAALPSNLMPDVVVTIQPGGMNFTVPAPLTLPNRVGYEVGRILDLWSINPETGDFDDVGDMQVQGNGTIVTISGGVTNSSWHFPAPTRDMERDPDNDNNCRSCKATAPGGSEIELDSGALLESHELVGYQSLGQSRALTLHYNSTHADPRPIIRLGFDNASFAENRYLVAGVELSRGSLTQTVEGFADGSAFGLPDGQHFWRLPEGTNDIRASIQGDLSERESGLYNYELTSGLLLLGNDNVFAGTTSSSTGTFSHVNAIDSRYGAGWQLSGEQRLIENPDDSILFIDGDGEVLLFDAPESGGAYGSPAGDFTTLIKNMDGTFTRTTTEQTVFQFDDLGRLVSVTDRNGNLTQHQYTGENLTKIIDPVGLETIFDYVDGRVSTITDPAMRETQLDYDEFGNVIRITDPDGSFREFEYDAQHHMVAETDRRGNREEAHFAFHGRLTNVVRKNGSLMYYDPIKTQTLLPPSQTTNLNDAPLAFQTSGLDISRHTDARGNVTTTILDSEGQLVSSFDNVGSLPTVSRNEENLVVSALDGRRNETNFDYDQRGNVISITDPISRSTPLFPGATIDVGDFPISVESDDLNGDGFADLVVANYTTEGVSVFLGSSSGNYPSRQEFAVGGRPWSVSTGDVNGDGLKDLVTANYTTESISILLGLGGGIFAPSIEVATASTPVSVAIADFNHDDIADIAVANEIPGVISVLIGTGDVNFMQPVTYQVGASPRKVLVADFDGDGNVDLAAANRVSNNISILRGTGNGDFEAPQTVGVDGSPYSVETGDLNGDGNLDLVTANWSAGNVTVLIGDGNFNFTNTQTPTVGSSPADVVIDDYDGDGNVDLVVANYGSNDVSVLIGNGDGTFSGDNRFNVGTAPFSIADVDFDLDGNMDLLSGNFASNDLSLLFGQGDGTFATSVDEIQVGIAPHGIATADFNDDGLPDLITSNRFSNDLSVLLGLQDGSFAKPSSLGGFDQPIGIVAGDLNGDESADLVVANRGSSEVIVLLGDNQGSFGNPASYAVGSGVVLVRLADFNNDSLPDLVSANPVSDSLSVLLNQGDGSFADAVQYDVGANPYSVTVGDFDGDGNLDLAAVNFFDNNVSVLLGAGDGTFGDDVEFSTGTNPNDVGVIDVNGDGDLDLVVANFGSNDVSLLLGSGDGTFETEKTTFPVGAGPISLITGDFDFDGNQDVATTDLSSDSISVLYGFGEGFDSATSFSVGLGPLGLVFEDLNADGVLDFATANSAANSVTILAGRSAEFEAEPVRIEYDDTFSQVTKVADELGRQTIYEIDPNNGNRLSMTQVIGELDDANNGENDDLVTTYTYTPRGQVDLMIDPLGRVMDYDYDSLGRIEKVTFALGTTDEAFQMFEYDDAGNQTALIDENGNRTEFEYDELNRITSITEADPDGNGPLASPVTTFEYDENGNLTRLVDGEDNTTINQYDELDRVIATISVNGLPDDESGETDDSETRFEYDPSDNVTAVIDPNNNRTENVYDARNRLLQTVDPDGGITRFTYGADE